MTQLSEPARTVPAETTRPAIEAHAVSKKYGKFPVLENVSIKVLPGEVYALAGPNGAGKTTLIRLLTGLSFPTSGKVTVMNEDIHTGGARVRRYLGAVVEAPAAFYPHLTGKENLLAHASLAGGVGFGPNGMIPLDDNRIREVLTLVELLRMQDRRVREYSLGQRQRLGLAAAILTNPKVLILDEPTSGLDPVAQEKLLVALRERARHGATVLFSSHSLAEVQTLCDRIAVIDAGRVLQTGTLAGLTGGTQTLRVWTRDAMQPRALEGWHANLVTPTHAILEGARLLQDALPRLEPFGVERAEFGGLGLEELLERAHRPSQSAKVQEVAR